MTPRDRDRLVVLKKAQKQLLTQVQAACERGVSERQVRRLLGKVKEQGDRGVIHDLRGRASNRKVSEAVREKAVRILSQQEYRDFGSTLASEYAAPGARHYNERQLQAVQTLDYALNPAANAA